MTKMEYEDAEKIYNNWYGEVTYYDDYYNEDETAKSISFYQHRWNMVI